MSTQQKFFDQPELDFVRDINHELIEKITGQEIEYYSVDDSRTSAHELYGESTRKVFHDPITINCLIFFEEPIVQTNQFGQEIQYSIEAYFHKRTLNEWDNLQILEGDYIKWGTVYYEIVSVTEPQLIWGRIENKMMIRAHCKVAREDEHGFGI